jgi:hypothetical protein
MRKGFNGIGPRIDTNLDEARRLTAIDSKLKKQREIVEMVNSQVDRTKSSLKE